MRNYLTFGGKDLRDFGVYISGQGTFSAPARAYNVQSVAGRNGDIITNEKRLENINVSYKAFIYTNFDANIRDLRNYLLSCIGYQKLTDSYHTDEYRMALWDSNFDPEVTSKNDAGEFMLTFNCKPQRFLNSGEEVTTMTASSPPTETYSGSIASFETDSAMPMQIEGQIVPQQSGSGDPSPDNVRPITGWTGANVTRTGKNLTTFFSDGKVPSVSTGQLVNSSGYRSDYVKCKPNTEYTLTATGASNVYLFYYDASHNFLGYESAPTYTKEGTTPATAQYIMCRIQIDTIGDAQLEEGTGTAIEPYTGNTITLSFGSTVYGGSYVVNEDGTVTLTVDRAYETWKWSAFSGATSLGSFTRAYHNLSNDCVGEQGKGSSNIAPHLYDPTHGWSSDNLHFYCYHTSAQTPRVAMFLPNATDGNTDIEVCYELATPITTTLPSVTMLQTLVGENNIWTDTGDISVTVTLPFTIDNPTLFPAQPLLRVYGDGVLGVNSQSITISSSDVYTDIDCEMMDAYKGTANKNHTIRLSDYNFPTLTAGTNYISMDGITKVEITPRWWRV